MSCVACRPKSTRAGAARSKGAAVSMRPGVLRHTHQCNRVEQHPHWQMLTHMYMCMCLPTLSRPVPLPTRLHPSHSHLWPCIVAGSVMLEAQKARTNAAFTSGCFRLPSAQWRNLFTFIRHAGHLREAAPTRVGMLHALACSLVAILLNAGMKGLQTVDPDEGSNISWLE